MTPLQFIFLIAGAVTLFAGMMVVTSRNMLHAALWLVLALFGVAVIFVTLQAGFFAVVQVVVYIGAIATLIIFAVMLTRRVMRDTGPQVNLSWPAAAVASLGVLAGLGAMLTPWAGFNKALPEYVAADQAQAIARLGQALVSPGGYVLPFEAASVLLLAALVGAIYVALDRK